MALLSQLRLMILVLGTNNLSFFTLFIRHVGGPSSNTDFKLVDVPELDYRATDKDKEGIS